MRIVFVINRLIYGGAETQVIALSRELALRGHSVIVYTLSGDNPRAQELDGSRATVVADSKRGKFDPRLVLRMRKTILDFKADIVHGFLLEGNLYARLAAAGTAVPALNSERNDNYHIPFRHRLALTVTRRLAAGVVANTHAGASFAQRLFRLPGEQVHMVWNGIETNADHRRTGNVCGDPRNEFFPLMPGLKIASVVGMFRPQKDHILALRVAEELIQRDPAWRVLFVGDSLPHTQDYKERVSRARDERGLGDMVRFSGVRSDVLHIVRQSNVLLSTSIHEGFPNVVIEAMSVGTPVVSTDYSDIKLILPNPWQVVASRSASELADAVIKSDVERERVARQQSEWLNRNATLAMEVDRLETVYRKYVAA
jgi:glycosyltransferase involved in cell wall biosynthesis